MRVYIHENEHCRSLREWQGYLFFGQQIQFDPKSKTDRKLFDVVMERHDINKKCGTVISECTSQDMPRCKKCGALPVRYYCNLGCVYGVVCPVCGTPTPDLPDNLKRSGGRS